MIWFTYINRINYWTLVILFNKNSHVVSNKYKNHHIYKYLFNAAK